MIPRLPGEGLEKNYVETGEEIIAVHDVWSDPDVARTPAVVATVALIAGHTADDDTVDCADECTAWDSGYQRDIIYGVTVYYGGDLCDSEESDWEDPFDIAGREYVDQYNFDLLEGMELMVFVPGGDPFRSDLRDDVGLAWRMCVRQRYIPDEVVVVANAFGQEFPGIASGGFLQIFPVATEFLRTGLIWMENEMSEVRTMNRLWIVKEILGWTGVIQHFGMDLILFLRMRIIHKRWWCLRTNGFQMRNGPIRLCWFVRMCLCWHLRKI